MDMEPLFAVRMTHDEDMYYNQVLASKQSAPAEKPGKKNFLSRVDLSDVIFGHLRWHDADDGKRPPSLAVAGAHLVGQIREHASGIDHARVIAT